MSIIKLMSSNSWLSINIHIAHNIGLAETTMYSYLCSQYEYFNSIKQLNEYGEFFCTADNCFEKTTLTRFQQDKAIQKLEPLGLLSVNLRGMPAKRFFGIPSTAHDVILSILNTDCKKLTNSSLVVRNLQTDCKKLTNLVQETYKHDCKKVDDILYSNTISNNTNINSIKPKESENFANFLAPLSGKEEINFLKMKAENDLLKQQLKEKEELVARSLLQQQTTAVPEPEKEKKVAAKKEKVKEVVIPSFEEFAAHGQEVLKRIEVPYSVIWSEVVRSKYERWVSDGWKIAAGRPIANWKNTLSNVITAKVLETNSKNNQNNNKHVSDTNTATPNTRTNGTSFNRTESRNAGAKGGLKNIDPHFIELARSIASNATSGLDFENGDEEFGYPSTK